MSYCREYIFNKLTPEKCQKLQQALLSIPEIKDAHVDFETCIASIVAKKPFPEELLRMAANITDTIYKGKTGSGDCSKC